MNWNDFCNKISEILGPFKKKIIFDYDESKITYTISSQNYSYTLEDYNELKIKAELYEFQRYSISNGVIYESIVDLPNANSRRSFSMNFEDKLSELTVEDNYEKITYFFKEVSEELIWYIIKDYDINQRLVLFYPIIGFEKKFEVLSEKNLFNILRLTIRLPFSVFIKSSTYKNHEQLKKYANSFLFNLAYNFDFVFKYVSEIEELFPRRVNTNRRINYNFSIIEAPQLSYKEELVEQYYMALSSEDPFVKFIGFYHIMEHFYEDVYNEDIFKSIQNIIQHPGFSSKRTKDIVKIVDLIKKKTRQSKEEFQGSEMEALELTLKKYVDISQLTKDLLEFDFTIIEYYKTKEVGFSKGDTIDLRDVSNEKLYKKLAARIYKTRNALVHNKSNDGRAKDRGIYKPFDNRKQLLMEIPLMKSISEAIIINSASNL